MNVIQIVFLTVTLTGFCGAFPSFASWSQERMKKTKARSTEAQRTERQISANDLAAIAAAVDEVNAMMYYGDVNKDGLLTEEEIRNFYQFGIDLPPSTASEAAANLVQMGDRNNDNKLNFHEAVAVQMSIFEN